MNTKPIFRSRTAALGLITAAAGAFSFVSDDLRAWVSANAPAILIGLGALSIALRAVTKGKVTLFPD